MKFTFNHFSRSLSRILNFLWYTGIMLSALTFVATVMFLFASYGIFDLKTPAISLSAGSLDYRFNSKYLEVINIEEIAKRAREEELGRVWKMSSREWWVQQAYESLYEIKFPPLPNHPGLKPDENIPVSLIFDRSIRMFFPGIFEIRNISVFSNCLFSANHFIYVFRHDDPF